MVWLAMVVVVTDEVLLDASRAGDVDAFSELVRRHEARVFRVALRMLGSRGDAEDVTQETFVRAWLSVGRFRGDSAASTWLYRIVTNRCLTELSGRREHSPLDDRDGGDPAREDPAEVAERNARMDAITAAVGALPADQRAALVLRDYEGLSYEDVADVLGIGLGAVKSRIHRGRAEVLKRTVGWR